MPLARRKRGASITKKSMLLKCEWGSVAACRGRGHSADRGPSAVPVPTRHRAPRARAPGTLARAPSPSHANGAAATERRAPAHRGRLPARRPTAVRTEPPHPRRLGRSRPPLWPRGHARRRRGQGSPSDPRGWKERLGDPREDGMRGWGSSRMEGAAARCARGMAAGCTDPDPRGWKERLGDPREDGRSGEAAGCGAARLRDARLGLLRAYTGCGRGRTCAMRCWTPALLT
jgi:hypothetical protein